LDYSKRVIFGGNKRQSIVEEVDRSTITEDELGGKRVILLIENNYYKKKTQKDMTEEEKER